MKLLCNTPTPDALPTERLVSITLEAQTEEQERVLARLYREQTAGYTLVLMCGQTRITIRLDESCRRGRDNTAILPPSKKEEPNNGQ